MKKLAFILAALPAVAIAQPAPQQGDPQTQALSQTVIDLTGQNVQLRTQLIQAQTEIKRLTEESAKHKAAGDAGK